MTQEEIEQHAEDYRKHIKVLNAMSPEQVDNLILDDQCPYEPQHLLGVPIGMFHCPLCGEMVVAGFPHGRNIPPCTDEELTHLAEVAGDADKVRLGEDL